MKILSTLYKVMAQTSQIISCKLLHLASLPCSVLPQPEMWHFSPAVYGVSSRGRHAGWTSSLNLIPDPSKLFTFSKAMSKSNVVSVKEGGKLRNKQFLCYISFLKVLAYQMFKELRSLRTKTYIYTAIHVVNPQLN